ncbi:hypothetical protein ACFLZB_01675 [Nanoarchaeota archaeon]
MKKYGQVRPWLIGLVIALVVLLVFLAYYLGLGEKLKLPSLRFW